MSKDENARMKFGCVGRPRKIALWILGTARADLIASIVNMGFFYGKDHCLG